MTYICLYLDIVMSTSNPMSHLRKHHMVILTAQENEQMSQNGEPSGSSVHPQISLVRVDRVCNKVLSRKHPDVRYIDRQLAKMFVSSNVSFNLLDNKHFGNYSKNILNGRYNIPGRTFMMGTLIPGMYQEAKEDIKKILRTVQHLTLCTDAWTSLTNASYITITAHVLDHNLELQSYVLDTTEILESHTSEHLLAHIEKVLTWYEISNLKTDSVTVNFNSTSYTDIHEQDEEAPSETNYLEQ